MQEELDFVWLQEGVILKNRYRLGEKIYKSDLSIIYKAYDLENNQEYIVKEFYPDKFVLRDIDDKTVVCKLPSRKEKFGMMIEDFLNEGVVLKHFNHKNIAKYIDHFVENNTGYIVIKHYNGITMNQYVRKEGQVSITYFLKNVFIPLLDAVRHIHKNGLIHRDIKPNNIIISDNGEPILIDFGSAVYYRQKDKNRIFVTPGFSPIEFYSEQSVQGKHSDIYSIAATLYYYLGGKAPVEVSERVIEDNIENVRCFNEEVSKLFCWILMRNLSLNYKKRFFSISLFKFFIGIECIWLSLKSKLKK